MKILKKAITFALIFILSVSALVTAGCGKIKEGPVYEDNGEKFTFYAYSSVSNGEYIVEGKTYYVGESYITLDRLKEYKDCGLDVIMPQATVLPDEDETSDTYKNFMNFMDLANQAGLKVIITDNRIMYMSAAKYNIINRDPAKEYHFADEEALDAEIERCLSLYKDLPAFYGVLLIDEPSAETLEAGSFGAVYKSIKRVLPSCYINANLCSLGSWGKRNFFPNAKKEDLSALTGIPVETEDFYNEVEKYVEAYTGEKKKLQFDILALRYRELIYEYLDTTGADVITIDSYPLYRTGVMDGYMLNVQVAAEVAKERGVKLNWITQTMTMSTLEEDNDRVLTQEDCDWLNNMLLGFGVKNIGYFTYFRHDDNSSEFFDQDGSFINDFGEKTDLYYIMQDIMEKNQSFAHVIFNFEYVTSATYNVDSDFKDNFSRYAHQGEFAKITKAENDKVNMLITELYDDDNSRYMYMIQNICDSQYQGSKTYQTSKITFSEEYNYAVIYENAERSLVKLDNHTLTVENKAGSAKFVIPY